jgi:hypothetical protein
MFENSVNIQGRAQGSVASAAQVKLLPGVYDVWSTADVYIKVTKGDTTASDVTSGTGYLIRSGTTIPVQVVSEGNFGVTGATTFYHQVA